MDSFELKLCLGSACHTKGSSEVISTIREWLKQNDPDERVIFSGCLCLGKCRDGINLVFAGEDFSGINKENILEFLDHTVKQKLTGKTEGQ